jgi:hypothetical protein
MINSLRYAAILAAALFVLPIGNQAFAADTSYALTLKDHKFSPAELTIPANTKVKISLKNLDKETAEFISDDFKGGKLVPGGKEASFFIGPLKAGVYEFHDEYHEAQSKTRLTVK